MLSKGRYYTCRTTGADGIGCPVTKRIVLLDDLSWEDGEDTVEFRLTCEGLLLASNTGRDAKTARKEYKRCVRRAFHHQLKRLWEITPHLRTGVTSGPSAFIFGGPADDPNSPPDPVDYSIDHLAQKHAHYGWNFVPLVTEELHLSCWLDILILRRMPKGELFPHADTDNRLETIFDCLQIPDAHQGYEMVKPGADETPCFCLLENDKMISKVTVETDTLLQDIPGKPIDDNDARLLITVRVRPFEMRLDNMQFG